MLVHVGFVEGSSTENTSEAIANIFTLLVTNFVKQEHRNLELPCYLHNKCIYPETAHRMFYDKCIPDGMFRNDNIYNWGNNTFTTKEQVST